VCVKKHELGRTDWWNKEEEEDFTEIVLRVEGLGHLPSITPLETVITSDSVSFDPNGFSFQKSANGDAPGHCGVDVCLPSHCTPAMAHPSVQETLDWRPRGAEKDLSGEAPERLGGQKRWAEESATPSANSGLHNVHQTLFSEADSKGPPRKLTLIWK